MCLCQLLASLHGPNSQQSIVVDVHQNPVSSSSEMPVLQPARQASQITLIKSVTGTSVKPCLCCLSISIPLL